MRRGITRTHGLRPLRHGAAVQLVQRGSVTINRAAVEADARLDEEVRPAHEHDPGARRGRPGVQEPVAGGADLPRAEVDAGDPPALPPPRRHERRPHRGVLLALRLEVDLQRRLDARGVDVAWPDLMRDLAQVQAVTVTLDGAALPAATNLTGSAHHAFAAAGVRPPAPVTRAGRRRGRGPRDPGRRVVPSPGVSANSLKL